MHAKIDLSLLVSETDDKAKHTVEMMKLSNEQHACFRYSLIDGANAAMEHFLCVRRLLRTIFGLLRFVYALYSNAQSIRKTCINLHANAYAFQIEYIRFLTGICIVHA